MCKLLNHLQQLYRTSRRVKTKGFTINPTLQRCTIVQQPPWEAMGDINTVVWTVSFRFIDSKFSDGKVKLEASTCRRLCKTAVVRIIIIKSNNKYLFNSTVSRHTWTWNERPVSATFASADSWRKWVTMQVLLLRWNLPFICSIALEVVVVYK